MQETGPSFLQTTLTHPQFIYLSLLKTKRKKPPELNTKFYK